MTSRITDDDFATHKLMVARFQAAQGLVRQAQEMQAQADRDIAGFVAWAEVLHEKYSLDAQKGEGIQEDGSIIKAAPPAPPRRQRRKR